MATCTCNALPGALVGVMLRMRDDLEMLLQNYGASVVVENEKHFYRKSLAMKIVMQYLQLVIFVNEWFIKRP